jgi:hypothetical protein
MTNSAERAVRRHIREKATIDRLVRGVRKPGTPSDEQPTQSPTTTTGLPVEEQIRKKWTPNKGGGLPTFWRDPPAFLLSAPRVARRARSGR